MEKRFLLFLLLSFIIFAGYFSLMQQLYPPKKLQAGQAVGQKQVEEKEKAGQGDGEKQPGEKVAEKPADEGAKEQAAAEENKGEEKAAEAKAQQEKPKQLPEEPPPAEQWIALGSADPDDPYRMLATFTNRGAALTRIELSSPRYRDIDDRSGYLGHLVMDKKAQGQGLTVQLVGKGTPADKAGIKVGDVIQEINGKPVTSYVSLEGENIILEKTMPGQVGQGTKSILAATRPGQKAQIKVLRDDKEVTLTAVLTRHPLAIVAPENNDPLSFLMTMQQIDKDRIPDEEDGKPVEMGRELDGVKLRSETWKVVEADQTHVVFSRTLAKYNLEIQKAYALVKVPLDSMSDPDFKAYNLVFSVKIINHGETARKVAYRLDGPNGLPTEGWWYASKVSRNWGGAGLRDVVVSFEQGIPKMVGCPTIATSADKPASPWQDQSLTYIGVDAQYFSVVMIPMMGKPNDIWFAASQPLLVGKVDHARLNLTNTSFRVSSLLHELPPGGDLTHKFEVFAGPKRPPLLAQYGLSELIYYGWSIFAGPAMLMSWILHAFYYVVWNYGLAIIMLTVLVRGCMFPLSIKQARGAQKMQELQPEIKRIAEKYKNDAQERIRAQQELFRKHNYNPFSGCLVLLIQLPIFMGLYRSLMVDVELRDAPLISSVVRWCSNLAAPDMLLNWRPFLPEYITTTGSGIFFLGPYLNVLPIFTIVLFLWQQKQFMPPPADEQAAMQQKVMKYMMIFMGILFFKVASGLCIYFIASSLWGLGERRFLPKTTPPGGAPTAAKTPPRIAPNGDRGAKFKKQKGR